MSNHENENIHGREETARKPQNENSAAANEKGSRSKRTRNSSRRANRTSGVTKTAGPESAKPPAPSKKGEVQEVLNAISSCTGKSLGVLLGTEKSPQNGNGPTNALANHGAEETSKEFIGRMEVARRLGKSLRTICYWMADGSLPFRKLVPRRF